MQRSRGIAGEHDPRRRDDDAATHRHVRQRDEPATIAGLRRLELIAVGRCGTRTSGCRGAVARNKPAHNAADDGNSRSAEQRSPRHVENSRLTHVSGSPDRVKNHSAAVSQIVTSSVSTLPPSTGNVQPGSPRMRRPSIFAA